MTQLSRAALCASPARTRSKTSQILGNLLAQYLTKELLGHWLLHFGQIALEGFVDHRLIPRAGFLCLRPECVEYGVIDEDGNAGLALLGNDRTTLGLREIVFSSYIVCVPCASLDARR